MFRATDFRPLAIALAVGLGVTACNSAESRNAPEDTEAAMAPVVPAGTSLTLTVDDDVASDSFRPGDTFTATLGADVADAEGRPTLTAGTTARWRVTHVTEPENGGQTLLAARLEAVQVDDAWHEVEGEITDTQLMPEDTDTPTAEDAQTVTTGTEAEAVIARLTGNGGSEDMEQGEDASAMAMGDQAEPTSALIAVTSMDTPAHITAGSRITVRLSDALVLGSTTDDEGGSY